MGLRHVAVDFHELRVVNIRAECLFHRVEVGAVPVRRELDAVGDPVFQIADERVRILGIPPADQVRDDELRVGFNRRPRPHVARTIWCPLRVRDVGLLRVAERPNLIDLHALGLHAPHRVVMEGRTGPSRVFQQLRHGVDRHVHHAADGAHGGALAEHAQDLDALREGQLVHSETMLESRDSVKKGGRFL